MGKGGVDWRASYRSVGRRTVEFFLKLQNLSFWREDTSTIFLFDNSGGIC